MKRTTSIIFFAILLSFVAIGYSNDNKPFNQTIQGAVSVNPNVSGASILAKNGTFEHVDGGGDAHSIKRQASTGRTVHYDTPTFAVFADPHLIAPSLIINDGSAFQTSV